MLYFVAICNKPLTAIGFPSLTVLNFPILSFLFSHLQFPIITLPTFHSSWPAPSSKLLISQLTESFSRSTFHVLRSSSTLPVQVSYSTGPIRRFITYVGSHVSAKRK